MSTLKALNARRITKANYWQGFKQVARELIDRCSFARDPHAFNYRIAKAPDLQGLSRAEAESLKNIQDRSEFLKRAAVMDTNKYPGDIFSVRSAPPFGPYNASAFIQRLRVEDKELLRLTVENGIAEYDQKLVAQTIERILCGEVMWEHMIGGKATRMKIDKEKFTLSPHDLVERYKAFYQEAQEESQRTGIAHNLPEPSSLRLPDDLGLKNSDLFGIRHMLAFAHNIKRLADETGMVGWEEALSRQTIFLIANEKIIPTILELFKDFGYFGLDPENIYFMATKNYDVLVLTEGGELITQSAKDYIHNHGVARLETTEDNVWFTIKEGERTPLSSDEVKEVYDAHVNLQSLNIEDLNYLTQAIDPHALTLALYGDMIVGGDSKYHMMMDVVGQKKDNPQKGGVLAYDSNFIEEGKGRLVMIESFCTYPRFFHYLDRVAQEKWREINWLNLNMNNYPNPSRLFEMAKDEGLPVWLEMKGAGFRNESPQGDANYFLPTLYVARTERVGAEDVPLTIMNLKNAADIPNGLRFMSKQQELPGFVDFTRQFVARGMLLSDLPYSEITRIAKTPLDLSTVLAHPFLNAKLDKRNIGKLKKLSKVFRVKGSLVYKMRIDEDGNVRIKTHIETMLGTGKDYPSKAMAEEIVARDHKRAVFADRKTWTASKKTEDAEFSYVLVPNRSEDSNEGEILMLLGKYDESVPSELKKEFLKERINRVVEKSIENNRTIQDPVRIADEFAKLPWKFLYENDASTIEEEVAERLEKAGQEA